MLGLTYSKSEDCRCHDTVEVFCDSDWAGDKSNTERRRHSVSSDMVFLDSRMVTSWSRTQRSMKLSSCESKYLTSTGAGAEALYIARLWKKNTLVSVGTDSWSGKAFSQRLGVGRIKHIDTTYLWLQKAVKEGLLNIDNFSTFAEGCRPWDEAIQ